MRMLMRLGFMPGHQPMQRERAARARERLAVYAFADWLPVDGIPVDLMDIHGGLLGERSVGLAEQPLWTGKQEDQKDG